MVSVGPVANQTEVYINVPRLKAGLKSLEELDSLPNFGSRPRAPIFDGEFTSSVAKTILNYLDKVFQLGYHEYISQSDIEKSIFKAREDLYGISVQSPLSEAAREFIKAIGSGETHDLSKKEYYTNLGEALDDLGYNAYQYARSFAPRYHGQHPSSSTYCLGFDIKDNPSLDREIAFLKEEVIPNAKSLNIKKVLFMNPAGLLNDKSNIDPQIEEDTITSFLRYDPRTSTGEHTIDYSFLSNLKYGCSYDDSNDKDGALLSESQVDDNHETLNKALGSHELRRKLYDKSQIALPKLELNEETSSNWNSLTLEATNEDLKVINLPGDKTTVSKLRAYFRLRHGAQEALNEIIKEADGLDDEDSWTAQEIDSTRGDLHRIIGFIETRINKLLEELWHYEDLKKLIFDSEEDGHALIIGNFDDLRASFKTELFRTLSEKLTREHYPTVTIKLENPNNKDRKYPLRNGSFAISPAHILNSHEALPKGPIIFPTLDDENFHDLSNSRRARLKGISEDLARFLDTSQEFKTRKQFQSDQDYRKYLNSKLLYKSCRAVLVVPEEIKSSSNQPHQ